MSPDLRKVHESARELRFAHPHLTGWVVAVLGAAILAGGWLGMEGSGRWLVVGFGVLMLLLGISGALYRMELTLDLAARRYRYRRGYVASIEEGGGTFDDVEALVLKKELESRGSDRVEEWEIELVLRDWPRPVELAELKDEEEARREAEGLAARLGVPLEERTGY